MPLFDRDIGVLLHPSSLPGPYGVGEIGPAALSWLDSLHAMGQSLWQILPLNPPGPGHSPYQARSTFANDTRLISLEGLFADGLLTRAELDAAAHASRAAVTPTLVDFELAARVRTPLLAIAARRLLETRGALRDELDHFREEHAVWLADYALYVALRGDHGGAPWTSWPDALRERLPGALGHARKELDAEIQAECALQFLFDRQWQAVHRRARELGIRIVGDIPIFVALDSADVWAHPELFLLGPDGKPDVVAGVPPDYFSATGQRWGNPLYDWQVHASAGFEWWLGRLAHVLRATDVVRVDHFRGFVAYWEIPASEPTAVKGRWVPAPGAELFLAIQARFGEHPPIIAEDLGIITDDVDALRARFGLPGMRVVQFSFGGKPTDLPNRFPENSVGYTGTHDNDTTVGWYWDAPELDPNRTPGEVLAERDRVRRYYATDGTDIQWTCLWELARSDVRAVVAPLQDLLGQGSDRRMNTPGTMGGRNWAYRTVDGELTPSIVARTRELAQGTQRGAFAPKGAAPGLSR